MGWVTSPPGSGCGGANFWAAKKHAVISPDKVSGYCASNFIPLLFRILLIEKHHRRFFCKPLWGMSSGNLRPQ